MRLCAHAAVTRELARQRAVTPKCAPPVLLRLTLGRAAACAHGESGAELACKGVQC